MFVQPLSKYLKVRPPVPIWNLRGTRDSHTLPSDSAESKVMGNPHIKEINTPKLLIPS